MLVSPRPIARWAGRSAARPVAYDVELQQRHRDRLIDRPKAAEPGD